MQNHEQYLTPQHIAAAAKTIQALDIQAEQVYNEEHAKEVARALGADENDVAELVASFNETAPSHILLIDGHGYRITLSLFTNLLMCIGRDDLAAVCLESREQEL